MSDQPDDDPNFDRRIPGLRQAVADLASVASVAGYRIVTISVTRHQPQEGPTVPPTRIALATSDEPAPPMATAAHPPETWPPRPHQSPHYLPPQAPSPSPPPTSKRASTSLIDRPQPEAQPAGKRKRFSHPQSPAATGPPSGPFWGTVLEQRPGTPRGMMPSQPGRQPPVAGPAVPPIEYHQQSEEEAARLHRVATFPALQLRSPLAQQTRPQPLPLFHDPAFTAAPVYRDRQPPPLEGPSVAAPPQPSPERSFLRRTGQLLGRLSPFGTTPSITRTTTSPPPPVSVVDTQVFGSRHLPAPALPALITTRHRPATEIFPQPGIERFDPQPLPSLQRLAPQVIPHAQVGPQSGSRSASGSGVSQARPSRTRSPQTGSLAEGSRPIRGEAMSRGKRGRRTGATPDREQFFECDQCNSKFRRKSDKNRHVRVVHEKSRPFMCPMCEKTFGEKSNMLKHRASVHDDVRTFRCPYCDAMFSQRGLCDTHVRTVHDKKQAKYFCEHCGLPFSRKVQLNEHYEQVHPEYMATYGRYQAGQSSTTPGMPSTSRTARGGPAEELAAEQRPFELSTAESRLDAPIPPLLGMGALARTRPPPTGAPQPWIPFTTSQPLTREQGAPEESSGRQRSFQGDSSGGQGQ